MLKVEDNKIYLKDNKMSIEILSDIDKHNIEIYENGDIYYTKEEWYSINEPFYMCGYNIYDKKSTTTKILIDKSTIYVNDKMMEYLDRSSGIDIYGKYIIVTSDFYPNEPSIINVKDNFMTFTNYYCKDINTSIKLSKDLKFIDNSTNLVRNI